MNKIVETIKKMVVGDKMPSGLFKVEGLNHMVLKYIDGKLLCISKEFFEPLCVFPPEIEMVYKKLIKEK